ncbi:TraJ protein (plasmid) [Erwinia tasmaniensis Et1/99]|uniref:TraJ protein n=1 Tax=Erwinia tasmaniensis (strain DSM 17950 / CFBP 7177 / CIP 109463 / NCPPB 4357 / Et1/99) TaxID=465817 RepID=B2VB53_ERWT9|nr:TraJ protein [Erwinia tasmaniensis Et1/99]
MAAVDPSQFFPLRKSFPELTDIQLANVCLFCTGCSYNDISDLRGVSLDSVKESLKIAQSNLGLHSSQTLRIVVLSRLFMHTALSVAITPNPTSNYDSK